MLKSNEMFRALDSGYRGNCGSSKEVTGDTGGHVGEMGYIWSEDGENLSEIVDEPLVSKLQGGVT